MLVIVLVRRVIYLARSTVCSFREYFAYIFHSNEFRRCYCQQFSRYISIVKIFILHFKLLCLLFDNFSHLWMFAVICKNSLLTLFLTNIMFVKLRNKVYVSFTNRKNDIRIHSLCPFRFGKIISKKVCRCYSMFSFINFICRSKITNITYV